MSVSKRFIDDLEQLEVSHENIIILSCLSSTNNTEEHIRKYRWLTMPSMEMVLRYGQTLMLIK